MNTIYIFSILRLKCNIEQYIYKISKGAQELVILALELLFLRVLVPARNDQLWLELELSLLQKNECRVHLVITIDQIFEQITSLT